MNNMDSPAGLAGLLEKLRRGLVVSCQAMEDEPLYGSEIMVRLARAAVRADQATRRQSERERVSRRLDHLAAMGAGVECRHVTQFAEASQLEPEQPTATKR